MTIHPPTKDDMKNFARTLSALALAATATLTFAAEGLIEVKSPHNAKTTMDKLEAVAKERGLNIFARIDHAAGAQKVGKTLRPTEVLIFGSPMGGTPLMECAQSAGIDLPLKALVWDDAQGQTWLGYNDPAWLAKRHDAASCPAAENLKKVLSALAEAVTTK
jgi:uncharacterized protein (DUF302 family)